MDSALIDALPPLYRLALAYAPATARICWLDFLALDARLAAILQQARDPVLAQIRLAWWREQLGQAPGDRPRGEPLLARLSGWSDAGAGLSPMVDGWEALIGEPPLAVEAIEQFARGRADALARLGDEIGAQAKGVAEHAARWAYADLACHFGRDEERAAAKACHDARAQVPLLDRTMRPLLVLERVSSRAMARGGAAALTTPGALFTAMRAGLLGR